MKKLFALLLAVVLVLGLVACAKPANPTEPNKTDPKNPTNGTSAPTTTTEPALKVEFPLAEEITIKYVGPGTETAYVDFNKTLANNKLWQDVYEATNIKVEIVPCANIDTLSGMMQNNSYGDIIAVNGIAGLKNNEAAINDLIASNKVLPIEEYVSNPGVMPNFNKYVLGEIPEAMGTFTSPNGHLYVLGYYNADQSAFLESATWINKTWLEKANMTIADVSTYEGLEKFFDWIMKNDPNGNNKQDELPYFCYPSGGTMIEALLGSWGLPTKDDTNENYITVEDEEVIFVPQQEGYKDFLTTMQDWWSKGYMYADYFLGHDTAKYSVAYEAYMLNNGQPDRVGFFTGKSAPARATGDKHPDPDNRCEYVCILPPEAEGYETQWYFHPGYMGTKGAVMVAANTEYPAEVCAWLDMFYNEEYSLRSQYGDEGSAWRVVDKDGKISKKAGLTAEEQDKLLNETLDVNLGAMILSLPYAITKNLTENTLSVTTTVKERRDAIATYRAAGVINPEVWPRPYMDLDDAADLTEIRKDIFLVVNAFRADAITGKKNLTTDWDAFQKQLKDDVEVERLVEICQTAYDTWLGSQK